ncbi:MAG: PrsW family intramembrane metalloprotease [Bacillota bacterium]
MYFLQLLAVSFGPGLLWVYYFYRKDKYEPEPIALVLKSFFYGVLAVFPAFLLEYPFARMIANPPNLLILLLLTVLVVGLVEEYLKYLVIKKTVYQSEEFNEVVDGIIYMISAGLGFAAFENLLYSYALGFEVGLTRAFITSLIHASFSGILGYYLGRAKLEKNPKLITVGLIQVVLLHGFYDFIVLGNLVSMYSVIAVVTVLYIYLGKLIKKALLSSPFK